MTKFNIQIGTTWQCDWPKGRIEPNRRIYDYEFVYFSHGEGRVVTSEETCYCRAGTVILIPPETVHCTIADSEVTRWCVHFDWFGDCPAYQDKRRIFVYQDEAIDFEPEFAARKYPAGDLAFPACFRLEPEHQERILVQLREFFRMTSDTVGGRLLRSGIFLQILGSVLEQLCEGESPGSSSSTFFRGKSLLDEAFTDSGLEIQTIAGRLRISPNHLNKLFRRHLGMSPRSYLLTRRLSQAAELLKNSGMTVQETAFASGFADANYFSRYFKRKYGVSPLAFRRASTSQRDPAIPLVSGTEERVKRRFQS